MYKKISNKIEQLNLDNPRTPRKKITWLNIKNPNKKEINYLKDRYQFQFGHLKASLASSISQRPAISEHDDYIFLVMQFSIAKNGYIYPAEVDFFIGRDYVITLHDNIKYLNDFFSSCKKDEKDMLSYQLESPAVLLYEIIKKFLANSFEQLDNNSIKLDAIEDLIFAKEQKKAVTEILNLRRNIINARKIEQNQKNFFTQLLSLKSKYLPQKQLIEFYNELADESQKIWDILNNQREMIEALHDTNASLLNYQISDIMKTLTIFSVIVFPLTLVAAIFGMNTLGGMPFIDNPQGFWVVFIFMMVCSFGMLIFFRKKGWLK